MATNRELSNNPEEDLNEVSQDGKYSKIFLLNKLFNRAADLRISHHPSFIDAMQTIHDTLEQKHTVEYEEWYKKRKEEIHQLLKVTHPNHRQQVQYAMEWQLAEQMYPRLNALTVNVDITDHSGKY